MVASVCGLDNTVKIWDYKTGKELNSIQFVNKTSPYRVAFSPDSKRVAAASSKTEPLTDKEKLLFVRGVGERTVQLLEDAGYRSVDDILREDEDKLAIKTGLGIKKARALKQGAEFFLQSEWKQIDAARKSAAQKPAEPTA